MMDRTKKGPSDATRRPEREQPTPKRPNISRCRIITQKERHAKRRRHEIALLLSLMALTGAAVYIMATQATERQQPAAPKPTEIDMEIIQPEQITPLPEILEPEPEVEEEPAPRYALTSEERDLVERVVMAEAGGEHYEGQMLVAQCILNAADKTGTRPSEVVVTYQYTKNRPEPTQSVRDAVAAVFDAGETVTTEPILFFYNPDRVTSKWHESQDFVIEAGGHRFFAERSQQK